jgi:hypothetical protein
VRYAQDIPYTMGAKQILEAYFIRKPPPLDEYTERLEEEFTLIDTFGFTKVFQQVYEKKGGLETISIETIHGLSLQKLRTCKSSF